MAPPEHDSERGWGEYRRLILSELERISGDIRNLNDKIQRFREEDISQIKTEIALLKFQAGLYGSVGGLIFSTLVTLALKFLR